MSIKEMPLQEKYDGAISTLLLLFATDYAFHKEMGTVDKWMNKWTRTGINMIPRLRGLTFNVLKALTPGSTFKRAVDQFIYSTQYINPSSTIEVVNVSDREATIRMKNCEQLKRLKDLIEKSGLQISPRFMCELDEIHVKGLLKEFGIEFNLELEKNGCLMSAKFK